MKHKLSHDSISAPALCMHILYLAAGADRGPH